MDVLRTAVSWIGAFDDRPTDHSADANLARSIDLLAMLPEVVAFDQRRRRGEARIPQDPSLSYVESFFNMCFGEVPEKEVLRCFDISLILYAEHSFNASTFAGRVITSTQSDLYSAMTGAIGALKGPLHGGANEAVMAMMEEIGDPAKAAQWLRDALASGRKIMGFGHRVYKHGDSRVPTMYAALEEMVRIRGGENLLEMYQNLEQTMAEDKKILPNLDFPSAPAYHLMGFDIPTFTPIFAMSRVTGWTAHFMEQVSQNALIRPLSAYVGPPERHVSG
jgi:citrate synthase